MHIAVRSSLPGPDPRLLLDAAPDGVFVADAHGRYIYVNPAGCRMTGCEPGEVLDPTTFDFIPGSDAIRLPVAGRPSVGEWVLRHKDGHQVPVEISTNALPDGEWLLFVRDVSERKRLEQQAQESERALSSIFDLLPVGVWIADRAGTLVRSNEAGRTIWGGVRYVGPEDYGVYKGWWVNSGQLIAAGEWGMARALKGETSVGELVRIQCFDGQLKTILHSAAPLVDARGGIVGAVCVIEDITALSNWQQRLQQSETLVRSKLDITPCLDDALKTVPEPVAPNRGNDGQGSGAVAVDPDVSERILTQEQLRMAVQDREHILAVVAHDLRSPLASISMGGAVLQRKATGCMTGQACNVASGFIMDASRRMAGLVDDLLAVSIGRSGGTMLKLAPVQVAELISMAAQQAAALADKAGLQLDWQHDDDLGTIQVDIDRILRVFGNLLDNALKFTEPGGRVVLRAEAVPEAVLFSVANSGPPVPAEDLERMFQPFWQAAREDRRGAGLGLSICRATVEAHGGTVRAEAAPGMRLKILFVLPRSRPQDPMAPAAQRQPADH